LGKGFDARAIGTLGSAGRVALVVPADSKIKTLKDLKGKTVATIFGTSLHRPAVQWSEQAGGAKVINISETGALRAALANHAVDAITSLDPFLEDPLAQKKIRILAQDKFDLITVASPDLVDRHPDVVGRFRAAMKEAMWYLDQHKDEVNGWFSQVSKLSLDTIDRSSRQNQNYLAKNESDIDTSISDAYREKLEKIAEFLSSEKLIAKVTDVKSHILSAETN
jgi:sulfonate transport system substrate-binding protein